MRQSRDERPGRQRLEGHAGVTTNPSANRSVSHRRTDSYVHQYPLRERNRSNKPAPRKRDRISVAGCGKGRFSPGDITPAAAGCEKGRFSPGGTSPAVSGCGKGPFFTRDTLCLPASRPQLLHFLRENVFEVFAVHFAVEVDEGGFAAVLGKGEYACTESRHINMTNVPKKG